MGTRSKRDSFKRDDSKRAEVIPGQSVGTHRPDRPESEYDVFTATAAASGLWQPAPTRAPTSPPSRPR